MTRFRLDLAYDGTYFRGWASQGELRTVQGTLEGWMGRILRMDAPPRLACAGRTDAGVHARGQVAHVDLDTDDPVGLAARLDHRFARALPKDLVVRAVRVAPAGFDARFSAVWRHYAFRLCDSVPDPLTRAQVLRLPGPLDVSAMEAAGEALLGLRDFAAYCRRREGASTIRTLLECRTERIPDGPLAGVVQVDVRADAFCRSMVRSLVGALVAVGQGHRPPEWPASLLERTRRSGRVTVLAPHGLTLEKVGYPPDERLAARAAEARARRDDGRGCGCGGEEDT